EVALATSTTKLQALSEKLKNRDHKERQQARDWADRAGIPFRRELPNGKVLELQRLTPGVGPTFYITNNISAADTVSTDEVWPGGSAGLLLNGSGMTIGEWDAGAVYANHPDLSDRLTQVDGATAINNHSTHVAGTLIASGDGIRADTRGMAYAALLNAYDWNSDTAEMALAASNDLLVSNHSYGVAAGWINIGGAPPDGWWWIGGSSNSEDSNFGYYDAETQLWDQIAFGAPYYLIVKAAGNDRWDTGPNPGEEYTIVDQDGTPLSTDTSPRPADCAPAGYDCLPTTSVAKNILTVGAVDDVPGGYSPLAGPSSVLMAGFSGWGPTDDGRIKPDVVGNGWLLLSTWGEDPYYAWQLGTSMAAPNVSGSLLLLQEHYQDIHGSGIFMRAATLKAVAIHTADESGDADGPDYEYGWGLLNTKAAARLISEDGGGAHQIIEGTLSDGGTDILPINVSDPDAIVTATLVWMDPPGTPVAPALDPTATMLVNDIDLRIKIGGSTYLPWTLNPASPGAAATTGDNVRDNVEQVVVSGGGSGSYALEISHKGGLLDGQAQDYSVIISVAPPPPMSTGFIIDEDFSQGLPVGWSVETPRGTAWTIRTPVQGDSRYDNDTGGTGNFAMVDNYVDNAYSDTITSLRTPILDLSSTQAATLSFNSFFWYDTLETINVDVSTNGGAGWINVWQHEGFSNMPVHYTLDLSGTIAGQASVMLRFRFQGSGFWPEGDRWKIDNVQLEVFGGAPPPPPPAESDPPGQASNPSPASSGSELGLDTTVSWSAGPLAASHNVYFGTSSNLSGSFHGNQTGTSFDPGALAYDTTYYWCIDEINSDGSTTGITWSFTTEAAPPAIPPGQAAGPDPLDGSSGLGLNTSLLWSAGSLATSHDVYFGTSSDLSEAVQASQSGTSFDPGTLAYATIYYWRIDEVNGDGTTTGSIWSFTTETAPPIPPELATNPVPSNGGIELALDTTLSWDADPLATSHDVYFGSSSDLSAAFQLNLAGTNFDPGTLEYGTTYFWRIDEVNVDGTTLGNLWSFTTEAAPPIPPGLAVNPIPSNGGIGLALDTTLSWDADPAATSHDVYFGASDTLGAGDFQGNQTGATFDPGTLAYNTTYYWRIDEVNDGDTTTGDTWSFTIDTAPALQTMHVGDLDADRNELARSRWEAVVTVGVHDGSDLSLEGATVTGVWGNGASGSGNCTSGIDGQCSISKPNLKAGVSSVSFTVTSVTHTDGPAYDAPANHDADSDSNGLTITVPRQPGSSNTPPAVSIDTPADSASFLSDVEISFSGNASDSEDGDLSASLAWDSSIDGTIGSGGGFSRTLSDGSHTITASTTDNDGASGSGTITITVGSSPPPPGITAHVELNNASTVSSRRWDAVVIITVHDASHTPLANAVVNGAWSSGANGSGSCTTNSSGVCSVSKNRLKTSVFSVVFTVDSISGTDISYDPGADGLRFLVVTQP
ncbi:MAG: hypothetical protein V7700_03875, partial [Halioglobus sp.]